MKILIAGGTGFIGRYLTEKYLNENHDVTIVGRTLNKIINTFGNRITGMTWDDLQNAGSNALRDYNLIINLAGATIGEKHWTEKRKQEIIESRTKTTAIISQLCAKLADQSPPLFNASAVGIYGMQKPEAKGLPSALDETTDLKCDNPPDFITRICCLWEAETNVAKQNNVRVVNMRFGVVFAKKGGALLKLALPFYLFVGGKIGNGQQPFSWVSIVDLARAINFLVEHKDITGPVNIVSPNCVTQNELAKYMGKVLQRPSLMPMPGFVLELMYGQMATELILNGQRAIPKVLQKHNFQFEYPDVHSALSYALK